MAGAAFAPAGSRKAERARAERRGVADFIFNSRIRGALAAQSEKLYQRVVLESWARKSTSSIQVWGYQSGSFQKNVGEMMSRSCLRDPQGQAIRIGQ